MTTFDTLLAEIVAHPESDELRWIFSDALSATDPEWAAHIVASLGQDWYMPRNAPSAGLETRIRGSMGRLAKFSGQIERGFVSSVQMTPQEFVEYGEQIFQMAPILRVVLSGPDGFQTRWNNVLSPVLECRALKRVRELSVDMGTFDLGAMCQVIRSPNIDRLIKLDVEVWLRDKEEELEAEMWELLFESSVFRGMIDWGLGMHPHRRVLGWMDQAPLVKTQRSVGDSIRIGRRDSDYYTITSYTPMPLEDRALEEKYGYIPRLHAGNWDATVLDVLRGVKPDFPVGARPVPEMYAVPPEKSEKNHGLDF